MGDKFKDPLYFIFVWSLLCICKALPIIGAVSVSKQKCVIGFFFFLFSFSNCVMLTIQ